MRDKGLLYAVGASIVAHGLVLALGSGLPRPVLEPRPIEARLLPRESAEAPAASRPAHRQPPAPHRVSPEPPRQVKTPPRSEAVAPPPQRMVAPRADPATPSVAAGAGAPVTTVHKADAAPAVITPAAPAPALPRDDSPRWPLRYLLFIGGMGGLLYGIENGLDWDQTGRLASLMGALKIACRGGQNHAPSREEIGAAYRSAFGSTLW